MGSNWFLEVTDIKQYMYCPRIVFYRYCLPSIRPVTGLMEEGIHAHDEETQREERRSLHTYGLERGERFFQLPLHSTHLGLTGRVDLAIAVPERKEADAHAVVVEYKFSEKKAGTHIRLQLAAYALLLEEHWQLPVKQAFVYAIPLRKAEPISLTPILRQKVTLITQQIRSMIEKEQLPTVETQRRCVTCEFRRFCNDVV